MRFERCCEVETSDYLEAVGVNRRMTVECATEDSEVLVCLSPESARDFRDFLTAWLDGLG